MTKRPGFSTLSCMYEDQVIGGKDSAALEPRYALLAAGWAVGTVLILLALKGYAYWQSGSAALLGSLVDSFTDLCISIVMLLAVRLSLKPADETHRHGHGKAEGIAALFQGGLLIGGAGFLALQSFERFMNPVAVAAHDLAIAVSAVAVVLSFILVMVQNYCIKRAPSLVTKADRVNYGGDMMLNAAVIAALFVDRQGGPGWVDPLCGLAIAAWLAFAAFRIGEDAINMLLDRELPDEVRAHILSIIEDNDDVRGVHDLRTRRSGMAWHISFDVELEPEQSLREAHAVSRELEMAILSVYSHAEIIIHKDPHGDPHDARHSVEGVHH
jgi:ferrous-iron efflux pump FieF